MERYAIAEKRNHLAIHGLFYRRETAEKELRETVPIYVTKSYFMDKTLTVDDFEVIEYALETRKKRVRK